MDEKTCLDSGASPASKKQRLEATLAVNENEPIEDNSFKQETAVSPVVFLEERKTVEPVKESVGEAPPVECSVSESQNEMPAGSKDGTVAEVNPVIRPPKYKRRKVALFIVYCGAKYHGMQKNPGIQTIESVLEEALFKGGGIPNDSYGDPRKLEWMRAARTDKGVSAVGQVVSVRLQIDVPNFLERTNEALPTDIKVLGFIRVTNSFSAKHLCDRRRYEYILPTFAFDPKAFCGRNHYLELEWEKEDAAALLEGNEKKVKSNESETQKISGEPENLDKVKPILEETTGKSEGEDTPFIFDETQLKKLNEVLKCFIGTHNFYNFTSRIKPEDPSAKRYILSFQALNVFEVDGMQFVRCQVVGQSFILHQIRKMIGLAVAVMRGCVPVSYIDKALKR